jgi:hypothetical protein
VSHHALGPSAVGAVVLDIGAGAGALIIHVPATEHGREIEVSGTDGHRTHAAVRERVLDTGSIYCVVYPSLAAGDYTIWADESTPAGSTTIVSGEITEINWTT